MLLLCKVCLNGKMVSRERVIELDRSLESMLVYVFKAVYQNA